MPLFAWWALQDLLCAPVIETQVYIVLYYIRDGVLPGCVQQAGWPDLTRVRLSVD